MTGVKWPMKRGAELASEKADDWRYEAACLTVDPEIFYPERQGRSKEESERITEGALAVCFSCPVLRECRADNDAVERGLTTMFGIRGGETVDGRTKRRRRMRRMANA